MGSPICTWDGATGNCGGHLKNDDGQLQYDAYCSTFSAQASCNSRWGGLSFSPTMFSYIGLLSSAGSVLGNFLFKVWLIRAQWHCMFASTVIIASAFSALQLLLMFRDKRGITLNEQAHMPNLLFALGD